MAQVLAEFLCPECERVFGNGYERCPFDGARLVNLGAGLAPGTVIDNRYTIKRLLGKGGMGSVYVGRQHSMDRDVAIKIMHHRADGNHASVQRFFWEVRAARRLQSPHTITVYDFGQTERASLYLVMELLKGTTLGHLLSVEQRVSQQMAMRVGMQICRSLEEAHSKGIIHRDLKPENIFLVHRNGANDFVKVLDFGVAKFLDPDGKSSLTQTGTVFGTPRYMSPEQANSEPVDARSDLYSLGIIMYEMLTGKVPFNDENALDLLYKQVHSKPKAVCEVAPFLGLDPKLGALVDRLLEKRREDRPQSAVDVREALEALSGELSGEGLDNEGTAEIPALPSDTAPSMPVIPGDRPVADTQQAVDAREFIRREMQTPSLGTKTNHDSVGIVGRHAESSAARAGLELGVRGPTGRLLVVTGEPGLGKERLCHWLASIAQKEANAVVAQGRRISTVGDDDMPEVRSALEQLLGVTLLERTAVAQALEDHPAFSDQLEVDLITALTDFLRPALTASAGTVDPRRLFSAVFRLLVRVSRIQPVVLDLGLLNRVAPATRAFIEYVVGALPLTQARLVILARVDTSSNPRQQALKAALDLVGWRGEAPSEILRHVAMRRLHGTEFRDFLQSLGKVYVSLVEYLDYLSGGVPASAAALVRQIESNPERLHVARKWNPISHRTPLEELPQELVDAAERLLDAALEKGGEDRHIRQVLRHAALIGYEIDVAFLEDCVAREEDAELLDAVEPAIDIMVRGGCMHDVANGERLRFDSGVLREILIARVRSPRAVKLLHEKVAGAIADLPAGDVTARALELAHHYRSAGDNKNSLHHHLVHARFARAELDPEEALSAYLEAHDVATELAAGGGDALAALREIGLALAKLHFDLGIYEKAAEAFQELLEQARGRGDELELAEAELGLAEVSDAMAEYGRAAELFRSAGERYQRSKRDLDAAWCELKRAGSLERRGSLAEAKAGYLAARQTFSRFKDIRGMAESHATVGMLALREGDASEAIRQLRRASDLYRTLDASLELGKTLYNLAVAATERRDLLMALDASNKALEIFDREDFRVGISQCLG
ncbi:MAG: protein kinase, partial [Myxococcales bacterium]|nr:protein kinase [Myxococcales bacterium]